MHDYRRYQKTSKVAPMTTNKPLESMLLPLPRITSGASGHLIRPAAHGNGHRGGFTLVEVMLAVALITIAALGTLCYQYLCIKHIRTAQVQLAATRIGQLLIEDWKSTGGEEDYDPEYLEMGFEASGTEEWGQVAITIDNTRYYISMLHEHVADDDVADIELRKINVTVRWKNNLGPGMVDDDDPGVYLTTYVRRDQ